MKWKSQGRSTYRYLRVVILPSSSGIRPVMRFPVSSLQNKENINNLKGLDCKTLHETYMSVRGVEAHTAGIVPLR